jgi:hypothetical protein
LDILSIAGRGVFKPFSLRETTAWMQEVEQRRERLPKGGDEGKGGMAFSF